MFVLITGVFETTEQMPVKPMIVEAVVPFTLFTRGNNFFAVALLYCLRFLEWELLVSAFPSC